LDKKSEKISRSKFKGKVIIWLEKSLYFAMEAI
jgi:hypothetical protein